MGGKDEEDMARREVRMERGKEVRERDSRNGWMERRMEGEIEEE